MRLSLRAATPPDAEPTWRFRRLDSASQWLTRTQLPLEDYRASFEDPDRLAQTLVILLDDDVIGDLMLAVEDACAQTKIVGQARGVHAELAWVLHPDHVGHGYATEAVRELIRAWLDTMGDALLAEEWRSLR